MPNTSTSNNAPRLVSFQEVQKHNTRESCWVIVEGQIYDATEVLEWHPGGASVILKNSGKDATKAFVPIHPPGTLEKLPPNSHMGPVDPATLPKTVQEKSEEEKRIEKARELLPPPAAAINLHDIERFAQTVLTATAWGYYRSAGDDENSFWENRASFKRFWFRPRVLNKISNTTTETTQFGLPSSLPIHISPAALARLGHPDGEMNLARAAGKERIVYGMSSNASCSREEILSIKSAEQGLLFQLYLNRRREASEDIIRKLQKEGFKGIILTVDAAVAGKRELDQRAKGDFWEVSEGSSGPGIAHAISGYQDPDVCWDDIPWIKSLTSLPLYIKGIQCVEDAERVFEYDVKGIILSNHGGRELDFAPAAMTLLYEIHQTNRKLIDDHEVYIDGGVMRGTDVLKALCLGARGVGLGRPFLYANAVWGEAGCRRVIEIMREEIVTGMRLMGVTKLDQLGPSYIRHVDRDVVAKL